VPQRVLTRENEEQAKELARQIRNHIEDHFPRPYDPAMAAKFRAMREELEKMGFLLQYACAVDF